MSLNEIFASFMFKKSNPPHPTPPDPKHIKTRDAKSINEDRVPGGDWWGTYAESKRLSVPKELLIREYVLRKLLAEQLLPEAPGATSVQRHPAAVVKQKELTSV